MHTRSHLVRFGALRIRRSLQGMAFMARLPAVGLLAGLSYALRPVRFALAST
jgi:hypothetical protein